MPAWKGIIDQMQSQREKSNELRFELLNYQYGYIAWCIGNNKKDEASDYLKLAEDNLQRLESEKFNLSRISGYKAAFYGFHIGLNIFSAPFIGPKSVASAKLAISLDPDDFFGYIQTGNVQFHAPALFGGSKQEALTNYLKAKVLMEKGNMMKTGIKPKVVINQNSVANMNELPKNAVMFFEKPLTASS